MTSKRACIEIIESLSREYVCESGHGDLYCFFCGEVQFESGNMRHEDGCPYVRGQELLQKMEQTWKPATDDEVETLLAMGEITEVECDINITLPKDRLAKALREHIGYLLQKIGYNAGTGNVPDKSLIDELALSRELLEKVGGSAAIPEHRADEEPPLMR